MQKFLKKRKTGSYPAKIHNFCGVLIDNPNSPYRIGGKKGRICRIYEMGTMVTAWPKVA